MVIVGPVYWINSLIEIFYSCISGKKGDLERPGGEMKAYPLATIFFS
jgi:hypothetical protein